MNWWRKRGGITAEGACDAETANMMRSATYSRLVTNLALVSVGFIFLQPLLVIHGPSSRQHRKLEEMVDGNGGLDRAAATVVKTEPRRPPTLASFGTFDPLFEDGVLKKQVFSSRTHIVFLVGLEGTGHHYMTGVLENMCQTAQVPCPKMCPLGRVIYPALSISKTVYDYNDARERLREEMRKLAVQVDQLPEGNASIAGFGRCREGKYGMMSYPNFNGPQKALQYVDLKMVVEESERAGIDLRIIYLTRAAKSILISDTIHHNYGNTFMMEARVLMTNAAVMESYFNEIDPAFTTCLRYENITSEAQAERVSRFVAPTEYLAEHLKALMLAAVKTQSSSPGHMRSLYLGLHRALGERESRSETRERGWPRSGRLGAEAVGPSVVTDGWRWQGYRILAEELNEAQKMITERLQQKIDALDRNLCSW